MLENNLKYPCRMKKSHDVGHFTTIICEDYHLFSFKEKIKIFG
jgi:hypothetical protein